MKLVGLDDSGWRLPEPVTKFTARDLKLSPVDARSFFLELKNSSGTGGARVEGCPRVFDVISREELGEGEGGVLERVVFELLFMDQRRAGAFFSDAPLQTGSGRANPALSYCEFERRKRLDIVRLKLEVEPRVDRR